MGDARQTIRQQADMARDVMLAAGIDVSGGKAEKIVLAAYKAGSMNDLNGRQDGGVSPEAWSVVRLIKGLEKHLQLDRNDARDTADAVTDAIHPARWTIRRLRRITGEDVDLANTLLADLHRHSNGRDSDLPPKMAEMGAITVSDIARLGHSLPPGWVERTMESVQRRIEPSH